MRKLTQKLMLLAWLGLPAPAIAAGFDCGEATTAEEKYLCVNPMLSRQDGRMAQALARARRRAGAHVDALLRDQRDWLAGRDALFHLYHFHTFNPLYRNLYDERIAFLDHAFVTPSSPLLAAIAAKAAAHPMATAGTGGFNPPWVALGGDGSVFQRALERWDTVAKTKAALATRFAASPALTRILAAVDRADDSRAGNVRGLVTLDASRLGGIRGTNAPDA